MKKVFVFVLCMTIGFGAFSACGISNNSSSGEAINSSKDTDLSDSHFLISEISSSFDISEDQSQNSASSSEESRNPYAGYYEYLHDIGFKSGFTVSSTVNGSGVSDIGKLRIAEGTSPVWSLAQWGSRYDIMNNAEILPVSENGAHSFFSIPVDGTPAKRVVVYDSGAVSLELNASLEYDSPRTAFQTWPHLLLAQNWNGLLLDVSRASDIRLIMDFSLDKFVDCMNGEENPSLHAAQFVWYVTLQNRNTNSAGYGEYLWFGLNLYDNRKDFPAFYAALDNGTSAFIYQPDAHKIRSEAVEIGKIISIDFPLLDYAKSAFELARERNFMKNTQWSDIRIGSMNTGFEIPGTYDIAVTIYNMSIKYKY